MSESPAVIKLKKLIAQWSSRPRAIGNQAEAEAFALRIAEMMTKHKLSMSDIEEKAQDIEDPFGHETVAQKSGSSCPIWLMTLGKAVAESMFCTMLYSKGKNAVVFIGRTSDRAACIALYDHLVFSAKKLVLKEYKQALKDGPVYLKKTHWRHAFFGGFAHGVSSRLHVQHERMITDNTTGLMLRHHAALATYMETRLNVGRGVSRSSRPSSHDAFSRGVSHGSNVSMHHAKNNLQLGTGR